MLANDSDSDGTLNTSSVVIEQAPANGTVTVNDSTGAVTYDHDGSDSTNDSFQYSVADDDGARSAYATVSIAISESTSTPTPTPTPTSTLTEVIPTDDGGARISVENAPANDPVSVDVPDEVEQTITSGGVTLDAVELSVTGAASLHRGNPAECRSVSGLALSSVANLAVPVPAPVSPFDRARRAPQT